MPFKVIYRDVQLLAETAKEAIALADEISAQRNLAVHGKTSDASSMAYLRHSLWERARANATADGELSPTPFDKPSVTYSFLKAIRDSEPVGADADTITAALGINHSKGIGGRSSGVNDFLKKLGFDPEEVYLNPRTAVGRFWKRGPKLEAALSVLLVEHKELGERTSDEI